MSNRFLKRTPVKIVQAVAAPGTAEPLLATETFALAFFLQAKRVDGGNTGRVYLGLSDVDKSTDQLFDLGPNDPAHLEAPYGTQIDLNEIYVDAVTATDGVVGWYIPA